MVGIPGSGKSYIANILAEEANGIVVSRDEIRFKYLKDDEEYFHHEKKVFKEYVNTIQKYLDESETVIADATHLNAPSRVKLLNNLYFTKEDYVVPVVIKTPFEICSERNAQRTGRSRVPDDVLKGMYDSFTDPAEDPAYIRPQYYDVLYIEEKENN
jgi:tRNA uridine 5-carbamoylmethylation protein Kti12